MIIHNTNMNIHVDITYSTGSVWHVQIEYR